MATGGYTAENDFGFLADFYFTIFIYSFIICGSGSCTKEKIKNKCRAPPYPQHN